MGLETLHPMWQYKIFREITKETDWKRFREECQFYNPAYDWCDKTDSFCEREKCPLIKRRDKA